MHIINLLLLQAITVFIVDLSGVMDSIKILISTLLTNKNISKTDYHLPLIGCSLCLTFWGGLIYTLVTNTFSISHIALVCLFAYLTPFTKELLIILKDLLIRIINLDFRK